MNRIITKTLLLVLLLQQLVVPFQVFADTNHNNELKKRLEQVELITEGKKVDIDETVEISDMASDRFVAFVKSNKLEQSKKMVSDLGGVFSFEDENRYGKVNAIPLELSHMNSTEKKEFLETLNKNASVIAVAPVQKRQLSSVPDFDDPLFPDGNSYANDRQWFLSQPSGSNLGIDALRAWQHIDSLSKPYGGDPNLLVAVIDTGAAYESYSKYNQFSQMSSPVPWVFGKASDFTDNIFVNTGEIAGNQLDDDGYFDPEFCLDINANGVCDTGELSSVFDDLNGFNVVDWGRYWSRVTYSELINSPVCSNAPYSTDGVRCVSETANDSVCNITGQTNDMYHGCFESDMGHPNDSHGHGTFVSNIIASKPNNSIGGVGIASNIKLLNIKIFGEHYNSFRSKWMYDSAFGDQIASAINYAVDMGAKIINMSFSGDSVDLYEKMAMDRAYYEYGVLLIAASGNSASSTPWYPAGYDSVLSVGASTKTGTRVSYSNYGNTLGLVAPVENGIMTQGMWDTNSNKSITAGCSWDTSLSCMNVDPLGSPSPFLTTANLTGSGTSFAAPQVTAVAALLKSVYPNLTAREMRYILTMSSMPSGSAVYSNSVGYGVLSAYNAVRIVDYRGKDFEGIFRMYQSIVSSSGALQTRYSDTHGARWSSWINGGSVTAKDSVKTFNLASPNGRTVQVMRGSNNVVYTRYANDFGYIGDNDASWSAWTSLGTSAISLASTLAGDRIIVSWKGHDNKIYTRNTTDGVNWGSSSLSSKTVLGGISMIYDPNSNVVVQAIRSSGYYVYIRRSIDRGQTWSSWIKSFDYANGDPSLYQVTDKIVRVVRGSGNVIVTRYTMDGGLNWSAANVTTGTSGMTISTVSVIAVPEAGILLQSYRGINNKVYTRKSMDNGGSWGGPSYVSNLLGGAKAASSPSTVNAGGTVVQAVKGSDTYLYYRRSTNGGVTWGGWRNKGSIKIAGNISLWYQDDLDRVFMIARGTDNQIQTRFTDDKGGSWKAWVKSGSTKSGVSSSAAEMDAFAL